MEKQQIQPAPAPASDTERELVAVVGRRRAEEAAKQGPQPAKLVEFPALERLANRPPPAPEDEARRAERALARERSQRDGQIAQLVSAAGRRYASCTFQSFEVKSDAHRKAVAFVDEWVDSLLDAWERNGLVLYGPVGTGKDHLAFAASRRLIEERGKSVGWVNGQSWFGEIRDAMDGDDRTEAAIVRRLVAPDILVLSDPLPPFGDLSQHQATMLYRAIEGRYSQAKPTVVTVNVADDEEADRRIGVATWDRICHDSWKLHCVWPSYRKPAREI